MIAPSFLLLLFLALSATPWTHSAFSPSTRKAKPFISNFQLRLASTAREDVDVDTATDAPVRLVKRRAVLQRAMAHASAMTLGANALPALAENTAISAPGAEMKTFVDPQTPSLFAITIPKRYYALRRKAKGDLPDVKTGQGRRGSSIFTAGDMAKAEVIAVERFPTAVLLEEEGVAATGDLSTFPALGNSAAIAELINLRRERDKPGQSKTLLLKDSVSLSEDGKTLKFMLRTEIEVQKPELLMEQMGVAELFRITVAKATLTSNDGQMMAVFASALSQDFDGPDGVALQQAVDSFVALDQSKQASDA